MTDRVHALGTSVFEKKCLIDISKTEYCLSNVRLTLLGPESCSGFQIFPGTSDWKQNAFGSRVLDYMFHAGVPNMRSVNAHRTRAVGSILPQHLFIKILEPLRLQLYEWRAMYTQ